VVDFTVTNIEILSLIPVFLLHLSDGKDAAVASFCHLKSKLHVVNFYFLLEPSFECTFCHFHSVPNYQCQTPKDEATSLSKQ